MVEVLVVEGTHLKMQQVCPPPQLTVEQARVALEEIYKRFSDPENRSKLHALVEECNKDENPMMAKMMKFPKLVGAMLKDLMEGLGFQEKDMMQAIFQIQMHAAKDPGMQSKVGILMQAFSGNLPTVEADDLEAAEVCD